MCWRGGRGEGREEGEEEREMEEGKGVPGGKEKAKVTERLRGEEEDVMKMIKAKQPFTHCKHLGRCRPFLGVSDQHGFHKVIKQGGPDRDQGRESRDRVTRPDAH